MTGKIITLQIFQKKKMDYVHCYTCYVQLKEETEHLFYISSCGKLYCSSKCLEKGKFLL